MNTYCIFLPLIAICLFGIFSEAKKKHKVNFAKLLEDDGLLVTYDAKFTCGVKMPRWCFQMHIYEYDPISHDKIAQHPQICTSKNTSGISLQAYFYDVIEQDDYFEPYAWVFHNCNKQRKTSYYHLTLPTLYRRNNSFMSHNIDLQLDGLGEPWAIFKFSDFNNYDDSPFLDKLQLFLNTTNNSTN